MCAGTILDGDSQVPEDGARAVCPSCPALSSKRPVSSGRQGPPSPGSRKEATYSFNSELKLESYILKAKNQHLNEMNS